MLESNSEKSVNVSPSKFKFKEKNPTPQRKLNAKSIFIGTGVFSALSALVLILAFSGEGNSAAPVDKFERDAIPADAVRELPADYAELARRRPKEALPSAPGMMAQPKIRDLSAEEKYRQELRLQRLKRAIEARQADVSFSSVKISSHSGGGSAEARPSVGLPGGLNLSVTGAPGAGDGLNPRDTDSRQDEKRDFLEKGRDDPTTLAQIIKEPLSPFQLMAGTVVSGLLLTGINSDLPGQLLGQVSQNVYDTVTGNYLLIPQGTKVLGTYDSKIVYGQERVLVVWTRLIFPNGNSINLEGMPGVDLSGYAGLSDSVNNHYLKLITGVVLGSILGAGAQVAQGSSTINPTFANLAAQGFAKNINEAGQEITRKNLSIQPTLEVAPGFRFNVYVTKDIVLEPYGE